MSNQAVTVTRLRAGLYRATAADRILHVEQIRTDTPGYGVENRWWISEADNGGMVCLDPTETKADAIASIRWATTQDGIL